MKNKTPLWVALGVFLSICCAAVWFTSGSAVSEEVTVKATAVTTSTIDPKIIEAKKAREEAIATEKREHNERVLVLTLIRDQRLREELLAQEKKQKEEAAAAAEAKRKEQEAKKPTQRNAPSVNNAPVPPAQSGGGLIMGAGTCGGDLPPCYVMYRESKGYINIFNGGCTSPCGGSTASGKWQFLRSTWGGYGGYSDAAYAPESVQDAKARQLWAGGAGCSHWSAC